MFVVPTLWQRKYPHKDTQAPDDFLFHKNFFTIQLTYHHSFHSPSSTIHPILKPSAPAINYGRLRKIEGKCTEGRGEIYEKQRENLRKAKEKSKEKKRKSHQRFTSILSKSWKCRKLNLSTTHPGRAIKGEEGGKEGVVVRWWCWRREKTVQFCLLSTPHTRVSCFISFSTFFPSSVS